MKGGPGRWARAQAPRVPGRSDPAQVGGGEALRLGAVRMWGPRGPKLAALGPCPCFSQRDAGGDHSPHTRLLSPSEKTRIQRAPTSSECDSPSPLGVPLKCPEDTTFAVVCVSRAQVPGNGPGVARQQAATCPVDVSTRQPRPDLHPGDSVSRCSSDSVLRPRSPEGPPLSEEGAQLCA